MDEVGELNAVYDAIESVVETAGSLAVDEHGMKLGPLMKTWDAGSRILSWRDLNTKDANIRAEIIAIIGSYETTLARRISESPVKVSFYARARRIRPHDVTELIDVWSGHFGMNTSPDPKALGSHIAEAGKKAEELAAALRHKKGRSKEVLFSSRDVGGLFDSSY
ncbi:hypothetical protein QQY66_38840 [Streptomyces sp. DG2A-72]|uniref:hypothetical protein n=1 Tax=Streptomyces sp. DG2A-72 TaxID=3051386 RepID=UPI00265C4620|nr:hypothetical protein [Streptomyces sp. DG2A-72]MDO0937398.1 hypothetical protein [Streptomyces sp. DG2A-72]